MQFFVTTLVAVMFTVAFAAPPWGAGIVVAFSVTSYQALFKSFRPPGRKPTTDKDQQPASTADILPISQAFTSLQKQRLWSTKCAHCCFMSLQAPVLGTPRLHSYLPKPVCCVNSEHLLPSLGSKPPHKLCFRCSPCSLFLLFDSWHFPPVLFQPLFSVSFQLGGAKL